MKKHKLDTVQFYISHTCNLGCNNCLSYNNFAIKGHDKFEDWAAEAEAWSKLLDPQDMSIIGGEPFSNPDLHNWVIGVRELFPDHKDFKICTNGTMLNKYAEQMQSWSDLGVIIEIHAHSEEHYAKAQQDLENILQKFDKTKFAPAGSPDYYAEDFDLFYTVQGKIVAVIAAPYEFDKWGVNEYEGQWTFYDSNPMMSHITCVANNCHYIYKGKLYKCGTIVGAQEFVKKYRVEPKAADLINSYKPIDLNDTDLDEQVNNLKKHIPQCSLCPTNSKTEPIVNLTKKQKLGLTNRI